MTLLEKEIIQNCMQNEMKWNAWKWKLNMDYTVSISKLIQNKKQKVAFAATHEYFKKKNNIRKLKP